MLAFLVTTAVFAACLPVAVTFAWRSGWIAVIPSFLYESTWLLAFVTTVIFAYLYRQSKPSAFVQLYLLSLVVKLLACFTYCVLMVLEDRTGMGANIVYFLIVYLLFSTLEIGFLYRRISGREQP